MIRDMNLFFHCDRSSRRRCSVRKCVLRNFAKFTGKHLWIMRNFLEYLFYRTRLGDCFFCENALQVKEFIQHLFFDWCGNTQNYKNFFQKMKSFNSVKLFPKILQNQGTIRVKVVCIFRRFVNTHRFDFQTSIHHWAAMYTGPWL